MQMLVIVVVERNPDGWSAWFRDSTHNVCLAECDILAVLSLIETHGSADMDAWGMIKLDARSRDDHWEYLLPCAYRRRIANSQDDTNQIISPPVTVPSVL